MGIFDKIKNAIWGADEPEAPSANPPIAASTTAGTAPRAEQTPSSTVPPASAPRSTSTASTSSPAGGSAAGAVDVAAILDAAVKRKGQKLDWRHSIVDLMKSLDLDSSLANRKDLANELNYTGDTGDSAKMNMWLHKALMKKLAENGGQVPPELTD